MKRIQGEIPFQFVKRLFAIMVFMMMALLAGRVQVQAKTAISELELSSKTFTVPYKGCELKTYSFTVTKGAPITVAASMGSWHEAGKTAAATAFEVGKSYYYKTQIRLDDDAYDNYSFGNPLSVKVNGTTWTCDTTHFNYSDAGRYCYGYINSPNYKVTAPVTSVTLTSSRHLEPCIGNGVYRPVFSVKTPTAGVLTSATEWYKKTGEGTWEKMADNAKFEQGIYRLRFSVVGNCNETTSVFLTNDTAVSVDGKDCFVLTDQYQISTGGSITSFVLSVETWDIRVGNDQEGDTFSHTDSDELTAVGPLVYKIISVSPAEVEVMDYNKEKINKDQFDIPETVKHNGITYRVVGIGGAAFSGATGVAPFTSVTIPSTVRYIGLGAFYGCKNLEKVVIASEGADLTIGNETFRDCDKLKTVYLPDRVKSIGNKAFGYKQYLPGYEDERIVGFTLYGNPGSAASTYAAENVIPFEEKVLISKTIELDGASIKPVAGQGPKTLTIPSDDARYKVSEQAWSQVAETPGGVAFSVFELRKAYAYMIIFTPTDNKYLFSEDSSVTVKNVDWVEAYQLVIDKGMAEAYGYQEGSLIFGGMYVPWPEYDKGEYVVNLTDGRITVTDSDAMTAIESTNIALIKEGKVKYIASEDPLTHMYDLDKDSSADIMITTVLDGEGKFKKADVFLLDTNSVTKECSFELSEASKKSLKADEKFYYSTYTIVIEKRDISKAVISKIDDQTFAGSALAPDFTVTYDGKTLVKDQDYTVSYSDNTKPGTAKVTITGMGIYEKGAQTSFVIKEAPKATDPGASDPEVSDPGKDEVKDPVKGEVVKDDAKGDSYKVTAAAGSKGGATVTYVSNKSVNVTSITIQPEVTIKGKKYKVTEIAPNAFKNNKKLKKVTIGKNIKKIGKNAFYGCMNLKTIIIKTTKLTKKTVGANAFKGIHKKAVAKVPKKKLSLYKKILKAKGMKGKKQKIKKSK